MMDVNEELPSVFRWMHGLLAPDQFRILPQLRITSDKDDPALVIASAHFWRRYVAVASATQ